MLSWGTPTRASSPGCAAQPQLRGLFTPKIGRFPLAGMMQVQRATDFGCFSDCSFPPLPLASICGGFPRAVCFLVWAGMSPELCVFWFGQGCPFPQQGGWDNQPLGCSSLPALDVPVGLREQWREAFLVKPEKFPVEDSVSSSGGMCAGRERGEPLLTDTTYSFTGGLQVLPVSIRCQPGCVSSHPALHRGSNTQPHSPPPKKNSMQSRVPRPLLQPAAKYFLAAAHPLPRGFIPTPPPRSSSLRSAVRPGGGTVSSRQRPPKVFGGDTRGDTACVPPPPWGGASPLPSLRQLSPTPTPPTPCQGIAAGEKKKKPSIPQPPKFSSLSKKKKSGRGGGVLQPGVIYPPGL